MTPRVSVIVPTRNRRVALGRALDSVNGQTYRDFELIVVDDGSTDGTSKWLEATSPHVRLFTRDTPAGAAAARNFGIANARGEVIALLDDDDCWLPPYLGAQVEHLDASPDAAVSYAHHVEVDPAGRRTAPDTRTLLPGASPLVRVLADCPIHTSSVAAFRREAFGRFGRFDERLLIVHDWEWYGRVVALGGTLKRLGRQLVERGVPGGLIAAHRDWYREESGVIARVLAGRAADERLVRTYRALYFGRLAVGRGDLTFGLARLGEAFRRSPDLAARLAAAAVRRRLSATDIGDGEA